MLVAYKSFPQLPPSRANFETSSSGSTCAQYNINTGAVTKQICTGISYSVSATNPAFVGYVTPAGGTEIFPTASGLGTPTSTSADVGLFVAVIAVPVVILALCIGLVWWCCCHKRGSWWNTRRQKYSPVGAQLPNTGATVGGTPSLSGPDYSNAAHPVAPHPVAPYTAKDQTHLRKSGGKNYKIFGRPAKIGTADIAFASSMPSNTSYGNNGYQLTHMQRPTPPLKDDSATARPTPPLEWKQSEPGTRTLTYQVEFIPHYIPFEGVQELFSFIDSKRVTVRSLAPSIGSLDRGKQTATVEYSSFTKNSKGPDLSSQAAERMTISVDRRFLGWTPLNAPSSPIRAE